MQATLNQTTDKTGWLKILVYKGKVSVDAGRRESRTRSLSQI